MHAVEDLTRLALENVRKHLLDSVVTEVTARVVGGSLVAWATLHDAVAERSDRALVLGSVRRAIESALAGAGDQSGFRGTFVRLRFESDAAGGPPPRPGDVQGAREFVESVPGVIGGRPVVRGTRIPAELIGNLFRQGTTEAELLAAYPTLDRATVRGVRCFTTNGA